MSDILGNFPVFVFIHVLHKGSETMKNVHLKKTILAGLFALSGLAAHAIEVGQVAPDFELPGRQGAVKLSAYKGKAVYLDFWASWCGPCKQSFPWMNEMHTRYGDKGLRVLAVNLDQKSEDAQTFLTETPARFEVVFDQPGKTPRTYAIKGMPTSVLIGPDGKVLFVHSGFKDEQRGELEAHIKQALSLKD